jgi:hypothetical protein
MGTLRVTVVAEYDVNPDDYSVETMEQAADEEREALNQDLLGTLSFIGDDLIVKVEVV